MGFFGDLKADFSQAVDELTDGTENETSKKENMKKTFGRKAKKNVAVKVTDTSVSEEQLFGQNEERSETEKALWDEIRADLAEETPAAAAEPVLTSEDVVEEIEEIKEVEEPALTVQPEVARPVTNTYRKETNFMPDQNATDEVGIITSGMTVLGNVYSAGHMEVYGNVEGDVEINGTLRLLGNITGNVKAAELIIESGKIKGNVAVSTGVSIAEGSVIIGEVNAGSGAVIAGAIKGDIDVHGPVTLDSTAIVKGNIKSQSVQMANGAMVDGMCSQCYSEVDLSSYFENM